MHEKIGLLICYLFLTTTMSASNPPEEEAEWVLLAHGYQQPCASSEISLFFDEPLHAIDQADRDGLTPLLLAVYRADQYSIKMLVDRGADVYKVTSKNRNSALHLLALQEFQARRLNRPIPIKQQVGNIIALLKTKEYPEKPLINCTNRFGHTALHIAWLHGSMHTIEALLEHHPNIYINDCDGVSVFYQAHLNKSLRESILIIEYYNKQYPSENNQKRVILF